MQETAVPPTDRFALPANLPVPQDDGGADHLKGQRLPDIVLRSTQSPFTQKLSSLPERTIIFAYPKTGRIDCNVADDWDTIPGARGCTPQTQGFASLAKQFSGLGYSVFGLSTQSWEYQSEAATRLSLPFALLSDADLVLTQSLNLPTFEFEDAHHGPMQRERPTLMKRMAWIVHQGIIVKVFYPVFPSNENAHTVLQWLQRHQERPISDAAVYSVNEQREKYFLSNDKSILQLNRVHAFLKNSHWAATRPIEQINKSIIHSDCYGIYVTTQSNQQVAFARIVTDHSTFAYLCDVYVDEAFRGKGLSKWMMEAIMANPQVKNYRRFVLATRDAHTLYEKFGFEVLSEAEQKRFMEILR
jgi:peroxiredoxin/predicted GNAT family N-acyltransferase